jgi:hypothetical protein
MAQTAWELAHRAVHGIRHLILPEEMTIGGYAILGGKDRFSFYDPDTGLNVFKTTWINSATPLWIRAEEFGHLETIVSTGTRCLFPSAVSFITDSRFPSPRYSFSWRMGMPWELDMKGRLSRIEVAVDPTITVTYLLDGEVLRQNNFPAPVNPDFPAELTRREKMFLDREIPWRIPFDAEAEEILLLSEIVPFAAEVLATLDRES